MKLDFRAYAAALFLGLWLGLSYCDSENGYLLPPKNPHYEKFINPFSRVCGCGSIATNRKPRKEQKLKTVLGPLLVGNPPRRKKIN